MGWNFASHTQCNLVLCITLVETEVLVTRDHSSLFVLDVSGLTAKRADRLHNNCWHITRFVQPFCRLRSPRRPWWIDLTMLIVKWWPQFFCEFWTGNTIWVSFEIKYNLDNLLSKILKYCFTFVLTNVNWSNPVFFMKHKIVFKIVF